MGTSYRTVNSIREQRYVKAKKPKGMVDSDTTTMTSTEKDHLIGDLRRQNEEKEERIRDLESKLREMEEEMLGLMGRTQGSDLPANANTSHSGVKAHLRMKGGMTTIMH
jgi:uncharacterized protein involved in exopolysaccharide biosynthesis